MLFDKICRKNGITHRLTAAGRRRTRTGRWSGSTARCGRELLDDAEPFDVAGAGAGGGRRAGCASTTPTGRTRPWTAGAGHPGAAVQPRPGRASGTLLPLWLPPDPAPIGTAATHDRPQTRSSCERSSRHRTGAGAVPDRCRGGRRARSSSTGSCRRAGTWSWPSGSSGSGPARAGWSVRFWADCDLIHLLIGGARVKTLALAPVGERPGPAHRRRAPSRRARHRCPPNPSERAGSDRSGRGRAVHRPRRAGLSGRAARRAGRGDPRRAPRRDPDRARPP